MNCADPSALPGRAAHQLHAHRKKACDNLSGVTYSVSKDTGDLFAGGSGGYTLCLGPVR